MNVDFQPVLENELIKIIPLKENDFETLFKIASDPLIWEQHPNKDRYKKEKFDIFFKGAMESKGAFMVFNNVTGESIGSSRFYGFDPATESVSIGYTFVARDHWGGAYNKALKKLMIEYAFKFAKKIIFHIGAENIRSQKAIEKIGAAKSGEIEMEYYGEPKRLNFIYEISKKVWTKNQF